MNVSRVFIERPVASSVLFLAILFFGWLGFQTLPVNDLPNVDFPTITVTASLPGAGPEIMANTVALPLERAFSQIPGVDEMTSSSSTGNTRITLSFSLDRDIDSCAQDVQTGIAQAIRQLPRDMDPPSLRKLNPADAPVLILAVSSKSVRMSDIDKFADSHISQRFSTVNGVAQVQVFGSQKYAVRVFVNPHALATRGIGLEKVVQAIQQGNANLPSGALQGSARNFTVKPDGGLGRASEFGPLIIAYRDGKPVRLQDVAEAKDGVENEKVQSWNNGDRTLLLAIYRQPGANTVEVVEKLNQMLPSIIEEAPAGTTVKVITDRSEFIRDSIHDVNFTLILSIVLVIGVILVFLRNFRATLVTALVLPISVMGTFAVMHMAGFSLNNLSLMAITLAVGFVVDDAIVVLENITRHMEMGKERMAAALEGAAEISTTVITMTTALTIVFVPILFMQGMVGRLFREFAATVGIAVVISGLVSLTITPMLCSRLLRPSHEHGRLFDLSERVFEMIRKFYITSLRTVMNFQGTVLVGSLVVLLLMGVLYQFVSKGFIPKQDTGVINGVTRAPEGTTFKTMTRYQQGLADIIQQNKNIESVLSTAGQGAGGEFGDNVGRFILRLKNKTSGEREASADEIIQQIRRQIAGNQDVQLFLSNPPAIRIGGTVSTADYLYTVTAPDLKQLYGPAQQLIAKMRTLPILLDVASNLQLRNPEIQLKVLRDRASSLGVTSEQIEAALYNAFGGRKISTIFGASDQYSVMLEVDRQFQTDINAMDTIFIQSSTGGMVPINSVAEIKSGVGPISVAHAGQLPAVMISFNLAPGVSVGDAVTTIQGVSLETLPDSVSGQFAGNAKAFQQAFSSLPLLILITILLIYMILAILYEHYGYPLAILTALPFAGFGALLTLLIFNQELNIFSFVGIILLIGLVKKNGIMMVDFALQLQREQDMSPKEAIIEACSVRFRPIMMTTAAAIFATIPIAIGYGAGAETRQPLGIAVIGGLVFSQFLTCYVTPVFYVTLDRVTRYFKSRGAPKPVVEAG